MRLPAQLQRKADSHKGDYGHVLVLGGSPGLTGAVCLSAEAALVSGAGLVTVGVPQSLNQIFEIKLTEVMSLGLSEKKGHLALGAFKKVKEFCRKADVLILGPGASLNPETAKLAIKVISQIDKPLVVDADAITILASNPEILRRRKTKSLILTPHLGEFSRLIKSDITKIKKKRKELVKKFAFRYNLILVLKGHRTLVGSRKRLYQNASGNPGMATAGSGDVLSGIIAGLIGQGLNCFDSAKYGTYLHGLAGDLAAKDKIENSLIASDLITYLPKAIKQSMPR